MLSEKIENFKKKYRKYKKIQTIDNQKKWNRFKTKFNHFVLMNWTWPKKLFLSILLIVLIGTILLYLPISYRYDSYTYQDNQYHFVFSYYDNPLYEEKKVDFSFVDALFTSVSAFTTTGMGGKLDLNLHMTFFGQFVIYVLFQIGGFGYASLFYLLGKFLQKIFNRQFFGPSFSSIERGGTKIADSPKMILKIFVVIVILQFIYTIIFTSIFYTTPFYLQQELRTLYRENGTTYEFVWNGVSIDSGIVYNSYHNFGVSLWNGLFLAGSSINNAGFDLFGTDSLALFRNDNGIVIQVLVVSLFLVGGIGYPIIYDLSNSVEYFIKYHFLYKMCKIKKYQYLVRNKFSQFTKICLSTSLIMIIFTSTVPYLSEYFGQYRYKVQSYSDIIKEFKSGINSMDTSSNPVINITPPPLYLIPHEIQSAIRTYIGSDGLSPYSTIETVKPFGNNYSANINFAIFFNAMSTRSAGFSTINMMSLSEPTKWIFIVLMFIGASPSSTGGGIRITTVAVMYKSMLGWLRGLEKSSLFKRNIPAKDVLGSYLITSIGFVLLLIVAWSTYGLASIKYGGTNLLIESKYANNITYTFTEFMFDSASAFGTCGLSSGIMTNSLIMWWAQIPMIVLMFIGQMGIGHSLALTARRVPKNKNPNYIEQSVRLG